ncbi:Nek protein kinase [Globisporangium polare]
MVPAVIPVKARDDAYTVLQQIGRGAFGDVFLCERKTDGATLCMKEVELHLLSPAERKGCLAEVELYMRLPSCPHIIGFHEAFWDSAPDQTLLLVLEYGDGGDLEGLIKARLHREAEPLNEQEALRIFHQLAMGVQFLHSHNVMHRDLKAKNVFLFANGRAVIGDFGTSKTLSSATAFGSTLVGSPLYMSPEILEGEPHSFPTDVWSLGCILYELLTSESPFAGPSYPAVVFKVTQGSYAPLKSSVSLTVRELVAKMLQKEQHKRPTLEDILAIDVFRGKGDQSAQQQLLVDTVDVVSGSELGPASSEAPAPSAGHCDSASVVSSAPIVLPPPAPVETLRAPSALVEPAQDRAVSLEPGKQAKIHVKASAVAVLPTSRAKVAHQIVSSQRLHLHRQQLQQTSKTKLATYSPHAPICHLDLGLPVAPPSSHHHQPRAAMQRKKTSASIPAKRPVDALPPANMEIIGRKVNAALLSSASTAAAKRMTPS